MLDRFVRQLYLRLGGRYGAVYLVAQGFAALSIATLIVLLLMSYYDASAGDLLVVLGVTWASTVASVVFALWRGRPYLARALAWQSSAAPSAEESIAAWDVATNYPVRSFRANVLSVGTIAAAPAIASIALVLGLGPVDVLVLLVASLLPVAYATVLNYFIAELLTRPLVEDIAAVLPEDFPFATSGLLIRKRLKILLPIFTGFVGLVVAALMTGGGGTRTLALSVVAAAGVGIVLSWELTVLLSRSVTAPIAALRVGVGRVRAGDYDVRVPVVTSDELGELSHDFNRMAAGLAEREELRETFGTYLDRDVAGLILSGRFPRDGVEVVVSIMFVDVRGFTSFAERSDAAQVVAALNALFEVMVPIVTRHGGHVDKFLGDGLLAVFGAPEGYRDHADRAVAAGLELARAVNRPQAELRIGVGVNTGPVVAGSIGGAGRLNFSVIGDAVNLAARVEAATRDTGDDMLITRATHDALTRAAATTSRGTVALKGKDEPVEVLACQVAGAAVPAPSPAEASAAERA